MAKPLTMHDLLRNMRVTSASDLHLKVGMPPIFRIKGELRMPQGMSALSADDTKRLLREIIPDGMEQRVEESGDLDFSTFHKTEDGNPDARPDRFRCNVFRAGGNWHSAIRRVQPTIPDFEDLGLPAVYRKVADETNEGLVLVIGVTGCGKSTTLACLLERVNQTRGVHIITVEDPIEYQIYPKMSVISQREIGIDVPNYGSALKFIVRQDPDVIFIGELRDHDTVLAAVQAAETGHLVFGSLHAPDTAQCFGRIVEFFPQNEHAFIRSALANSMKAILAQRLLPANVEKVPAGVAPATEVLLTNGSVREKIREAEDNDLPAIINSSRQSGMRSFTHSLAELVEAEIVNMQTALEFAPNREALQSLLKGVEVRTSMLVGKIRGG
ncbi:MAG: PilT/PilU family type 4a pilus ATPase [Phycisphaerales bacterium]|nr:PilT/PilU family type 4a pilus ATPase [Phycisphaerales bacterium]